MKAVPRIWRRYRTLRRVYKPAAVSGAASVAFVRFMYGALRNGKFTGDEEREGRKRWVAVYDASVKALRALLGMKP